MTDMASRAIQSTDIRQASHSSKSLGQEIPGVCSGIDAYDGTWVKYHPFVALHAELKPQTGHPSSRLFIESHRGP
jgi:hypothetical protein